MSRGLEILRIALVLVPTAGVTSMVAAQPRVVPTIVEQPRPFGYVIGDVVTQRVLLTTPREELEPTTLPPIQRVNNWFVRRASRIETAPDGRRWLAVDYQLINSPQALATVHLPAWKIEDKTHDTQFEIPAASLSAAPLISNSSSSTDVELRPDREVSSLSTTSSRAHVLLWSIALGVILLAWLAWLQWRNWRDSYNRPFARAAHQLRRMDEMAPEAWQTVHRAFDQTAGRVLQTDTLPTLFERAPYLQPQRAEIERFFTQSNERFFGAGVQNNLLSVRALCLELRRIERQHAQ